jgi:hypothetical protein
MDPRSDNDWKYFKLDELFASPSLRPCQSNVIRKLELWHVTIVERPTCRDALAGVRVDEVTGGISGALHSGSLA